MPVEIRELIIKASIGQAGHEKAGRGDEVVNEILRDDRESFVKECVEQVLEILKERKER